jgi:lipopolysaccharide/colanic/teichoic acid biosynthesis glycosyltransferase
VMDMVFAAAMLACVAPLFLLVAMAIRLDSPGAVFFRQRRIGRNGREFTILKFRSMAADADPGAHERFIAELALTSGRGRPEGLLKLTDDPRVTRVGAILRKTSADELPQLLNVLAGSMSIVGPRPAVGYELAHYQPEHFERFDVRPGITGLWQVSGRNRLGFTDMLDLDVEYVRTRRLAGDLVAQYDRTRSDERLLADLDTRQQDRAASDSARSAQLRTMELMA